MAKVRKLSSSSIRAQRIRLRIFGFVKEFQAANNGAWPTASIVSSLFPDLTLSIAAIQYHMKFLYNAKGLVPFDSKVNFINRTLRTSYATSGYANAKAEADDFVALDEIIKD